MFLTLFEFIVVQSHVSTFQVPVIKFVCNTPFTYITNWVLLHKLVVPLLVRKILHPYVIQHEGSLCITRAHHLALFWSRCMLSQPISVRFSVISSHWQVCLPSGLLPSGFPIKTLYAPLIALPCIPHSPPISSLSFHLADMWRGVPVWLEFSIKSFWIIK